MAVVIRVNRVVFARPLRLVIQIVEPLFEGMVGLRSSRCRLPTERTAFSKRRLVMTRWRTMVTTNTETLEGCHVLQVVP
jgi:hypothetical protein